MKESPRTRQFSAPLFVALIYVTIVTLLFGGEYAFSQMPLLATCLALFFSTYGATFSKVVVDWLVRVDSSRSLLRPAMERSRFARGDYR